MNTPVFVPLPLVVGVPSAQSKAVKLSEYCWMLFVPIRVKLLICGDTAALRSKLLEEINPQCIQSAVPSVVRSTLVGGKATPPANNPPVLWTKISTGVETVLDPPLSVAFAVN